MIPVLPGDVQRQGYYFSFFKDVTLSLHIQRAFSLIHFPTPTTTTSQINGSLNVHQPSTFRGALLCLDHCQSFPALQGGYFSLLPSLSTTELPNNQRDTHTNSLQWSWCVWNVRGRSRNNMPDIFFLWLKWNTGSENWSSSHGSPTCRLIERWQLINGASIKE